MNYQNVFKNVDLLEKAKYFSKSGLTAVLTKVKRKFIICNVLRVSGGALIISSKKEKNILLMYKLWSQLSFHLTHFSTDENIKLPQGGDIQVQT